MVANARRMLSTRNQLLEHGPPTLPRGPFWHPHLRKRQRRESCETVAWTLEVGMPFAMQTWLAGKLKCWNSTFVYQWKFSFQVPASIAGKCGGQSIIPRSLRGSDLFLPELFDSEVKLWPKMPWPRVFSKVKWMKACVRWLPLFWRLGIGALGLLGLKGPRPDFGVEPRPLRQFRLQPSSTQKCVHFGTGFAAGCIIFHGSSGCVPR